MGRWQGQADIELTDLGYEQARRASEKLGMFDAIVSSDLRRAHLTATIIANEFSVLYYLSADKINRFEKENAKLASSIHELVARTLGTRIAYMNRRLIQELR